jgi:glutathione synthase/RimK-type ligase-like ATP-grasp enzyme
MILLQKQKYSGGDKNNGILCTSGSKLAEALGVRIYTPRIVPKKHNTLVLNWGVPAVPTWSGDGTSYLNHPYSIRRSSNKLTSFRAFKEKGLQSVTWTDSIADCLNWFEEAEDEDKKIKVVCRTKVTGCSGEGIVIADRHEELVQSPLYTLYTPKKWEFRVHVINGRVVHIQQKRRLSSEQLEQRGIVERCKYIRNLENGYIFSTNLDPLPDETYQLLSEQSVGAVEAVELDFGAVDLLVTSDYKVALLEVNSAPGLEGVTLEKYVNYFREWLF